MFYNRNCSIKNPYGQDIYVAHMKHIDYVVVTWM
jgi:hypothetical protein